VVVVGGTVVVVVVVVVVGRVVVVVGGVVGVEAAGTLQRIAVDVVQAAITMRVPLVAELFSGARQRTAWRLTTSPSVRTTQCWVCRAGLHACSTTEVPAAVALLSVPRQRPAGVLIDSSTVQRLNCWAWLVAVPQALIWILLFAVVALLRFSRHRPAALRNWPRTVAASALGAVVTVESARTAATRTPSVASTRGARRRTVTALGLTMCVAPPEDLPVQADVLDHRPAGTGPYG
jgi:hypothetical protein